MFACACACLCLPVFACLHLCLPVRACVHLCLPVRACVHLCLPVRVCVHLCLPVFACVRLSSPLLACAYLCGSSPQEAETLAAPMAKDKGLKVTFAADPSLPESVVGDGNRLLQVLLTVVRGGRGEDGDDIGMAKHG